MAKFEGGIPLFLIGLASILIGLHQWKRYRKIADISTSKVRSMAAGLVELNGKVVPIETIISPVAKKKCVYYVVLHQAYVQIKGRWQWKTVNIEKNQSNFYLQDETGKVEVNPTDAEVDIFSNEATIEATSAKPTTRGYPFATGGKYRDVEYRIDAGDTIYVLGSAKIKPGVKSAKNEENFVVGKGENDPFYYITDKSENQAKEKLGKNAKIFLAVGAALIVASLIYFTYAILV